MCRCRSPASPDLQVGRYTVQVQKLQGRRLTTLPHTNTNETVADPGLADDAGDGANHPVALAENVQLARPIDGEAQIHSALS